MYETMSISSGLYPNLDLWNANKLQLQLQYLGLISNVTRGVLGQLVTNSCGSQIIVCYLLLTRQHKYRKP